MNFGEILYHLIIGPIELVIEFLISAVNTIAGDRIIILIPALGIFLSLLMAPFHVYARRSWRKTGTKREIRTELVRWIPFLLEIPMLAALTGLLSDLSLFNTGLGPIWNLSSPDAMISLGGSTVNVLPLIATVLFFLAAMVSAHSAPIPAKLFLAVLTLAGAPVLYPAPASAALTWGIANLICLGENFLFSRNRKRKYLLKKAAWLRKKPKPVTFLLSAGLFSLLTGLLIPSSVLFSSPTEFLGSSTSMNPLWYVFNAFLTAAGISFIWFGALYFMARKRTRKILEMVGWVLFGIMLINYLFFRNNLGILTSNLQYETAPKFSRKQIAINLLVLGGTAIALAAVMIREDFLTRVLSLVLIVALGGLSVRNIWISSGAIREARELMEKNEENAFHISLSQTGQNVVVLMLDRAIGVFIPAVFYEKPELKDKFSGFTFYPNTLSHGAFTNFGTPGLFGGYEYTPAEMNKRDQELLSDKHNEALKVMPALFGESGYSVTVCNPSYAGYQEKPDLSIYHGMKNVSAFVTDGMFETETEMKAAKQTGLRNYFCYAVSESVPLMFSAFFYNMGNYHQLRANTSTQSRKSMSVSSGISGSFMRQYAVLQNLSDMTEYQNSGNTFLMMVNKITHTPALLTEPDYQPAAMINNETYDREHENRFRDISFPLEITSGRQMSHYHALMAAMIQIGDWLDTLRANNVYDNTRIILVADHGRGLDQKNMKLETGEEIFYYNPLLMVKDFGTEGTFVTDETFMTNADTPSLAMKDLLTSPIINPFTGMEINGEKNKETSQAVTTSHDWRLNDNNGYTFLPADWFAVHGNMLDLSNWEYIGKQ